LLVLTAGRVLGAPESVDRSTPRRAMMSFLLAAESHEWSTAATVLDVHALPPAGRAARAAELAEQLHYVLERNVWIEPERLSDDPQGRADDGPDVERIGLVRVQSVDVPIALARVKDEWLVSASTVARIPRLYEERGPGVLEPHVPPSLRVRVLGLAVWQWLGLAVAALVAYALGRAAAFVFHRLFERLTQSTRVAWDEELIDALRRPSRFLFGVLSFQALVEPLALSAAATHIGSRVLGILSIGAAAWILIGLVGLASTVVERRSVDAMGADSVGRPTFDADVRAVRTQVRVLRRVINVAIGIVAIALMLTQFEVVRNVGVSLLASAGVAGVVLGFAAQRTFGTLIAGIQLSFTQPIRIGDVVVVEKEWGTIEEVTLTFVVVKVWDERRLIVPMTRFLEQPFENWTKVSPELHGTVFLHVDWRFPVDALRTEVDRLLDGNALWDRRTKGVAVTGANDRTLEVRVLVSATDAGTLWDLRVQLRERLVAWLQAFEGGRYLPQLRVEELAPPLR
jgi:hypothetical protein